MRPHEHACDCDTETWTRLRVTNDMVRGTDRIIGHAGDRAVIERRGLKPDPDCERCGGDGFIPLEAYR